MARRIPQPPAFKNLEDVTKYLNEFVRIANQQTTDLQGATNPEINVLSTSLISVDSAYKAGDHTFIVADASAAPFPVTLPAAKGYYRKIFVIKKANTNTNAVTVQVSAGGTIDSMATAVLSAAGEPSLSVISDGTEYKIF